MGERDIEVGWSSETCRDPGYDLVGYASFTKGCHLFSSMSEDEGIASLEAYDPA